MGLLSKILGTEKNQPYLDAGTVLIDMLTKRLNLPDWKDLIPTYTPAEIEAIDSKLSNFQRQANEVLGGEPKVHPKYLPELQRMMAAVALSDLAGGLWGCLLSDELPPDWKQRVSTYLKAWVANFDATTLVGLGELLVKARYWSAARVTFRVILLFPTYAKTFYGRSYGQREAEMVEKIVNSAKLSLQNLG